MEDIPEGITLLDINEADLQQDERAEKEYKQRINDSVEICQELKEAETYQTNKRQQY
jgi:hypothetical protein